MIAVVVPVEIVWNVCYVVLILHLLVFAVPFPGLISLGFLREGLVDIDPKVFEPQ